MVTIRRLTQLSVEVPSTDSGAEVQVGQVAVEVPEHTSGSDLNLRLTQMALQIAFTQPVHPFSAPGEPVYLPWSPAFYYPPEDGKSDWLNITARGHVRVHDMGARRVWIEDPKRR